MSTTTATARDRYARKNEEEDLQRAFQTLDIDQDNRLSLSDITHYLSVNHHHINKKDILDMVWEVDDDCDGFVDWEEFQKMYERCRNDEAGNEPRSLFNIALFAMHATTTTSTSSSNIDSDDKETGTHSNNNTISFIKAEDLYKMMYLKVGPEGVESHLSDVFQLHDDVNSGRVVKIQEFLRCLEKQLVEQRVISSSCAANGKKNIKSNGMNTKS